MRSARLPLVRKHELTDYRKNQARSILFLLLLTLLLLVSVLLSLRAGSYNTPVTELIKGIFGRSADKKINLVIRNNYMTEEEINYVLSPERMLQPGEDKELQKKIEERLG